jgi:DNA-binding NarL/FixJ family response regulator
VRDIADERALADALAEGFAGAPAIALVDDAGGEPARALIRAGARGVLPRTVSAADLDVAVAAVARGFVVLTPSLPLAGDAASEKLTPREHEVLDLLAAGLPNRAIATRLGLSDNTVKFHVTAILGKLNAATRTEAVTLGIRRGLIML